MEELCFTLVAIFQVLNDLMQQYLLYSEENAGQARWKGDWLKIREWNRTTKDMK